jgi:nucleotide-binding universal stress UspA family protein
MSHTERPILCATDFSPSGQTAVDLAVSASRAFGRSLVLVHAMDTGAGAGEPAPRVVAEADRVLHERVEARVADARAALERERSRHAPADIQTTVLDGRAWEAIVAHAAAIDASMIVLGAHGSAGPTRITRAGVFAWLLGSTADRVVRTAACPVLVATAERERPVLENSHWVIGVALDEASGHALEVALQLASRAGSRADVVHVAPSASPQARAESAERARAEAALGELVANAAAGITPAPHVEILHGDPAEVLVATAADRGAPIALGTHGRRGVARALLGSVAERVLRTATTPVLIVPPRDASR